VKEFPYHCILCDADFPSPTELGAHTEAVHAPHALEDLVALEERTGDVGAAFEQAERTLGGIPILELAEVEGFGARLERLRTAAAAAIAEGRRPRLVELRAELEAIHVAAAEERDRQARIAKLALESASVVAGVLEILPEGRP